MPIFAKGNTRLYYEEHGAGDPLLLIAPGGMRSSVPLWANAPWDVIGHLAQRYRVIAMDQRNAGQSSGPVSGADGWDSFATDQLDLMDHLGIDSFATVGMCIGGPYCLGLAARAPERVRAVVLFQPIGLDDNREIFYELFDSWADNLRRSSHKDVSPESWASFRANLFDGPFLFNLSREQVAAIATPTLILRGDDPYHPDAISRSLAQALPNGALVEHWKEPEHQQQAQETILRFLRPEADS